MTLHKLVPITFEAWKKANPDLLQANMWISCKECGGSKEYECPKCDTLVKCKVCDGIGEVLKDHKCSLKTHYDNVLAEDKIRIEKHLKLNEK